MQLFSIHGFIRKGAELKQVPLYYILMSRRTAADYKQVFKAVVKKMGGNCDNIKEVVSDYERAIWRGVEDVFPSARMYGCAFHWTQAVFRNFKKIGLVHLYSKTGEMKSIFKKVLALHLLPYEKIPKTFKSLEKEAIHIGKHLCSDDRRLMKKFFVYVKKQWINSKCWGPKKWSVFNQAIRTNNDAEGWHNRVKQGQKRAQLL